MRLKLFALVSMIFAVLQPTHAAAEDEISAYAQSGWYLSAGVTTGFIDSAELPEDTIVGLSITGGNRVHPNFAAEFAYERLAPKAKTEHLQFTANAKAFLLTGRFQPFALIGLGVMRVGRTDEGFAQRFGGGIDVYVTESIAVNLEASYYLARGDAGLTALRAGLLYRFQ